MSKAIIKALEERLRQVGEEGFDTAHDDEHSDGEIAAAAASYVISILPADTLGDNDLIVDFLDELWPWDSYWWKPSLDPKRNIIKAMALLAAEYERIERAEAWPEPEPETLYSTDDEWQSGMWDDLLELIADRELQAGDTVYFGTKRNAQATDFTTNLDELVIEGMQVQAEDDAGEVAEDYPSASEPQIQVLQTLIEAWATTYCNPDFYQVLNTQRYTITAADVEEASRD